LYNMNSMFDNVHEYLYVIIIITFAEENG